MAHTNPSGSTRGRMLAAVILAAVTATMTATAVLGSSSSLDDARAATARFNSLNQAIKSGYGLPPEGVPLHECIMSLSGTGGMGFHYINGGLLDGTVDVTQPEALVYAPDQNGNLRLVALEYVVFEDAWEGASDPVLFGQTFELVPAGNRYDIPAFFELHAWIWEPNPGDLFDDFNPNVSCN
jgi:hypothetical protein